MLGQRHHMAHLQGDFYCQKYRKILRWLMMAVSVVFILLMAIIYLVLFSTPERYYANTTEGKILVMPLGQQR